MGDRTINVKDLASPNNLSRFAERFDVEIKREWLITNGRGGYASGTVLQIPTRRYHGLLVAAARPPLERWLLLSAVLERVGVTERHYEPASFEFLRSFHPRGFEMQADFSVSNNSQLPWVRFAYEHNEFRLSKQVLLPRGSDEVLIRYRLEGAPGTPLSLELCPFVAMRDFHSLTQAFDDGFPCKEYDGQVAISAFEGGPKLWLHAQRNDDGPLVTFDRQPDWWYGFIYREESARGQDNREDLFVPGWFRTTGTGTIELELRAVADFRNNQKTPPRTTPVPCELPSQTEQTVEDRLREAADAFVVTRRGADGTDSTTVLAGYHWFGDWGRDTFIALPGLLLETERFAEARQVLETFASAQQDGLIPNRFSDYGDGCDYNSVDASLWYIHAADAYCELSGDKNAWRDVLGPTCERVLNAFATGTNFNIHVADDGLVSCGDASTQLTWMDAKCGDVTFTPRHGKPVEINALWYHGLRAVAARTAQHDPSRAAEYNELADRAKEAFVHTFWNDTANCLYDVVRDDQQGGAIRPNQIFAVSLPHSPLNEVQQQAVVSCVERELLTPYGLRSLSPKDPAYRGHYEGGMFERDGAYHQGTVWGWLIGPFVEAYLRVHGFSDESKSKMRALLQALIDHLDVAGVGSVSEIFDGNYPHTPRGCIGQAWSVAELLRAWRMTQSSG